MAAAAAVLVGTISCVGARLAPEATVVSVAGSERAAVGGEADGVDYDTDVRPILEARCVSCHARYDAPCQMKAIAPEGLDRGAGKEIVYHADRLTLADPSAPVPEP